MRPPRPPRSVDLLLRKYVALLERRATRDAILAFRDAIRVAPETSEAGKAHNNIGSAYQAMGRIDDAVGEFRDAVRLHPGTAEHRTNLAIAYEATGQIDAAAHEYREVIRLFPRTAATAHHNLAGILLKQGRLTEAVEELRRAIDLAPTPQFICSLAIALDQAGDAEAIAHYQHFLDIGGDRDPKRVEEVARRLAYLRTRAAPSTR